MIVCLITWSCFQENQADYLALSTCLNITLMDFYFSAACCNSSFTLNAFDYHAVSLYPAHSQQCSHGITNMQRLMLSVGYNLKCPVDSDTFAPYSPPGMLLNRSALLFLSNYSKLFMNDGQRLALVTDDDDSILFHHGSSSHSVVLPTTTSQKSFNATEYARINADVAVINTLGLLDSRFDCAVLPSCSVSCAGPDPAILRLEVERCTCMSEWFFHAHMLQTTVAVVVFILQNISRFMVCKGLIRVFYRQLKSDDRYDYLATCNDTGKMIHKQVIFAVEDSATNKGFTSATGKINVAVEDVIERSWFSRTFMRTGYISSTENDSQSDDDASTDDSVSDNLSQGDSESGFPKSYRREIPEPEHDVSKNLHDSKFPVETHTIPTEFASCDPYPYADQNIYSVDGCSIGSESYVKAAVVKMLASYERAGYMYITIGLILNVPWLLLLALIRSDLTYEPNADAG
jgi:hypothetical protein